MSRPFYKTSVDGVTQKALCFLRDIIFLHKGFNTTDVLNQHFISRQQFALFQGPYKPFKTFTLLNNLTFETNYWFAFKMSTI